MISILGWYGHGNVGDEAFKLAFAKLLPDQELDFVEKLDNPGDIVILGGGDVVHSPFTNSIRNIPAEIPKIAVSVTLTSRSDVDVLRDFRRVFVRDEFSLKNAEMAGLEVELLPDITFGLSPNPERGRRLLDSLFEREHSDRWEKTVVCVASSYLSGAGDARLARDVLSFEYFATHLAKIADNVAASFVFLPFSTRMPHDDRVSNAWVGARCKYFDKNLIVFDSLSVEDTLDVVAAADTVISTRFHSTIFATLSGVPFVDISHHSKNLGFVQTLGKQEWSVPYYMLDPERIRGLINGHLDAGHPNEDLITFTDAAKSALDHVHLF